MKRYILAAFMLIALAGNVLAQKDITSQYITNAALANGTTGWTVSNFNAPVVGPNTGVCATESYAGWSSLSVTSFSLTQKITLPKGSYRLSNKAFFRQGEKYNTNATKSLAYLKAGSKQVAVKTLGSASTDTYPNNQADGADCLATDTYLNTLDFDIASDNTTIVIGITGTFDQMRSWCITAGFELTDLLAKDDRKGLLAALERFERDYNLADGTDYGRLSMSAEAWATLIGEVNTASLALDDAARAEEYSDLRDVLNARLYATDASIALFNEYLAAVEQVKEFLGTAAAGVNLQLPSDTDTDATLRAAIDRLNHIPDNYQEGYLPYLTAARGFTEVTSVDDIIADPSQCYILTAAENTNLFVGIGAYEAKPGWAGEDTKALRYRQAGDPVADLSNFFTIEKENGYIGLRNVVHYSSLFQTHDNAGYMYVLTYTEPTMSDWCYLKPTFQDGYWLFENGKYPIASDNWACGYMGPWNNRVEVGEPIALNRRNTEGDEAGHYRLFRISRADLLSLMHQPSLGLASGLASDATWRIANPSFETGDETGWTLNGKDPEGNDEFKVRGDYTMTNKDGDYLMNAFQWWAASLSVSQTIADMPAGEYQLSGVVATWEGRTVTFSGNSSTVTQEGQGDQIGIPVSATVAVGTDGKLTINVGSAGQWWVEGHEEETQTFFKLDNLRLQCRQLFVDGIAVRLPNDETPLIPGQWYYYDVDYSTDYLLLGPLDDIVCTTDGLRPVSDGSAVGEVARIMTLPVGRAYFKVKGDSQASVGGDLQSPTLVITPYRNVEEGTFTAVALNVDGLPNTVATVSLNPDGPGSDGTKKISQYLASKGYDLIGCSEDFNYHGSLISSLMDNYSWGTVRATLSIGDLPWSQLIQVKFRFDTDGLNLIWKKSTMAATNESWTQWNSMAETEGNQYVRKGFRHYDLWLSGNVVIDVYVLHMDAGDTDATWSRHEQWEQLCDAINASDHTRAKLIIGDTNSRWTREDIASHFTNRLSSDLTMSDVWVELYRNGIYPTTDMGDLYDGSDPENYTNYEIVDKIIYINPTEANTVRLTPQAFRIEHDYTYGYVNVLNGGANDDDTPLGDHHPVVVTFKYQFLGEVTPTAITLYDDADNTAAIANADGVVADVTLQGRTLYKDGSWNTLCLPFAMTAEQVAGQLAPDHLMELDVTTKWSMVDGQWSISNDGHITGLEGNTLYLNFKNAESIAAGTPYIIRWNTGTDLVSPTFHDVTLSAGGGAANGGESAVGGDLQSPAGVVSHDAAVTFQGIYAPAALKANPTNLYLTDNNTLAWPVSNDFALNAFRAYFLLSDQAAAARQQVLTIGDVTTAIQEIDNSKSVNSNCYDLQGRRIEGQPAKPGLYIQGGKKVMIK